LWSQAEIRLVINTDPEGFAHDYTGVHGPSVCAMGWRVDDARQALERAKAYLCQPFQQAVGPGEAEIPAIHGLDDSLVYLVDDHLAGGREIWEVDFVLDRFEQAGESSAGLTCIDHISQITTQDQLASAALFYHAVMGLAAFPPFEVVDPRGLMEVRVMETADRSLRIALCAPQSQGTMAGRFLSEYAGSGVHQVGFRTADIFKTVERLEANGVSLLPIPDNYFDDLEARFGPEPALVEALRKHGILYDRNDQGEFFHAYTRTYAGRFFFEVIERRGYADFGAANATIRLAAQARIASEETLGVG
jgi:4-hydroxyphenylpyruvate dioxygenase